MMRQQQVVNKEEEEIIKKPEDYLEKSFDLIQVVQLQSELAMGYVVIN